MQGCRPFSDEEYRTILSSFEGTYAQRDRCLFVLGTMTGLRISSLLSLTIGDVWRGGRVVDFVRVERRHMKGKTRGHTVVLNAEAKRAIEGWITAIPELRESVLEFSGTTDPGAALFQSQRRPGKAIGYRQALRIVQGAVEVAGVSTVSVGTHSMRKTGAKLVYEVTGGDYRAVQAFLNQKSVASTEHYLGSCAEKANAAVLSIAERLA